MFQKSSVVENKENKKKKKKRMMYTHTHTHIHNNYGDTRLQNLIYLELELRTLVKI